jgi:hypothetical protein
MKNKLREKFTGEPPHTRVIAKWEEKLFNTGVILDKSRSGRPNVRVDHHASIVKSIAGNPNLSVRMRARDLYIPTIPLYCSMKEDLGYRI